MPQISKNPKKKLKKKKKPSITCLKRKCDHSWSRIIQLRAKNKCERCGSVSMLNSHHILGRVIHNLRYSLENGIALCTSCHKWGRENSAHENPVGFIHWLEEKKGRWYLEKLDNLAHEEHPDLNYELVLAGLKRVEEFYSRADLTDRN